MAATAEQTVEHEEITEPKISHSWTYYYALFVEPGEYEYLPCPAATQGAHLVPAPPSPKVVAPRHDASTFCKILSERLRGLARRQSMREHLYGEEFANEWPISRTPRALAKEINDARQRALEERLHLNSPSSESDVYVFEPSWRKQIREWKEKKRQARKLAKEQAKLSLQPDAEDKTEQPTMPPTKGELSKKRKAPPTPTPLTPSPKKSKVA